MNDLDKIILLQLLDIMLVMGAVITMILVLFRK